MHAMDIFARAVMIAAAAVAFHAGADPVPPPSPSAPGVFSAELADGARVVTAMTLGPGATAERPRYAWGVWKLGADGRADPLFNVGFGYNIVPIWGVSDSPTGIAVQPDGKILIIGSAVDPRDARLLDGCAHCGRFPAVIRLKPNGEIDIGFNAGGKLVLDVPAGEAVPGMMLRDDGKIDLFLDQRIIGRITTDGIVDNDTSEAYTMGVAAYPYVAAQGLWTIVSDSNLDVQLAISQQDDTIFGATLARDASGVLRWQSLVLSRDSRAVYKGNTYQSSGPPAGTYPFIPAQVSISPDEDVVLEFTDETHATLEFLASNGDPYARVRFQRFPRAARGCTFGGVYDPADASDLTDFWVVAPPEYEPGWGVYLHQWNDGSLRSTWFTYDGNRQPIAYQGSLVYAYGDWTGTIEHGSGNLDVEQRDGNDVSFNFILGNMLDIAHSPSGSSRLMRMVYREPGTTCR
jgi:hypothetical protein